MIETLRVGCPLRVEDWTVPLGKSWVEMQGFYCRVFIIILTTFTVNIILFTWICHLSFSFLRIKTVKLHKALYCMFLGCS